MPAGELSASLWLMVGYQQGKRKQSETASAQAGRGVGGLLHLRGAAAKALASLPALAPYPNAMSPLHMSGGEDMGEDTRKQQIGRKRYETREETELDKYSGYVVMNWICESLLGLRLPERLEYVCNCLYGQHIRSTYLCMHSRVGTGLDEIA